MGDKRLASNDTERILAIADNYGSVSKIPKDQIAHRSEDGKTVVTVDGTKVSDLLIAETKAQRAAEAKAVKAAAGAPGVDPEELIARAAEAGRAAAREEFERLKGEKK